MKIETMRKLVLIEVSLICFGLLPAVFISDVIVPPRDWLGFVRYIPFVLIIESMNVCYYFLSKSI